MWWAWSFKVRQNPQSPEASSETIPDAGNQCRNSSLHRNMMNSIPTQKDGIDHSMKVPAVRVRSSALFCLEASSIPRGTPTR